MYNSGVITLVMNLTLRRSEAFDYSSVAPRFSCLKVSCGPFRRGWPRFLANMHYVLAIVHVRHTSVITLTRICIHIHVFCLLSVWFYKLNFSDGSSTNTRIYSRKGIKAKAQNPYLSVSVQERRVEQDLNRRTKIGDEPANCCWQCRVPHSFAAPLWRQITVD